ncbi:hypothetical protein ACLB2K_027754 [Fragaria x ananassa]
MQVFKLPPDLDRKTLYPPEKWKVSGVVSAEYKCGQPIRVDPTEFPDPSGLQASTLAIASWQVICNITRPQSKKNKCCVSFSSYYNESVIPCNTCACGCLTLKNATLLPEPCFYLLKHSLYHSRIGQPWLQLGRKSSIFIFPNHNLVVTIVELASTGMCYQTDGWTARITLFNWMPINFEDWFAAVEMKKGGGRGYENAYSMNGTKLANTNNIIFLQGLKGLNFLVMQTNGTKKDSPAVPGKQQSVISFKKARTPGIQVAQGDGFPAKVYFNGEECALPTSFPSYGNRNHVNLIVVIFLSLLTFAM